MAPAHPAAAVVGQAQSEIAVQDLEQAFRFVVELGRLQSLGECTALFRKTIEPLGFDTFACGEIDPRDRQRCVFYVIGWTEQWRRFYTDSGMIDHDPVVDGLASRREPFTWSDLRADRSFSNDALNPLTVRAYARPLSSR